MKALFLDTVHPILAQRLTETGFVERQKERVRMIENLNDTFEQLNFYQTGTGFFEKPKEHVHTIENLID